MRKHDMLTPGKTAGQPYTECDRPETNRLDSGRRKILVIDSHSAVPSQIHDTITKMGHIMLTAAGSAMGIQIANRESPDLILVDIELLKQNGYEVSRQLKENPHTSDIPIIVLSIEEYTFPLPSLR